jgi:hypothetical protein
MASQATRTSMVNSSCDWVRARLALWVGDRYGNGQAADAEGGDLCPQDSLQIERHLDACASCRQDRTSLEHALQTLWNSAGQLPVEPVDRSLWSRLEDLLANHHGNQSLASLHGYRTTMNQTGRIWADLDDHGPLRRAWARDTLREVFRRRNWQPSGTRWKPGWLAGTSLVAACLALLIVIPALHQQWSNAQNAILANSAPLDEPALPSVPVKQVMSEPIESSGSADVSTNELAEADSGHSPEAPAAGLEGSSSPKKTSSMRFGYDLEHGIPSVPDPRDAKPVY